MHVGTPPVFSRDLLLCLFLASALFGWGRGRCRLALLSRGLGLCFALSRRRRFSFTFGALFSGSALLDVSGGLENGTLCLGGERPLGTCPCIGCFGNKWVSTAFDQILKGDDRMHFKRTRYPPCSCARAGMPLNVLVAFQGL